MDLAKSLVTGLDCLELKSTLQQQSKLLTLLEQLLKWNKSYNLTAIKEPMEGLSLHLLDSLAVIPYIRQQRILDVGTGAGFPGLPLAIMLPKLKFTLLDSNSKKIRFIRQQIHFLNLDNVSVIHSRVEQLHGPCFDGIISRAFASITDMVQMTGHLLDQNGCWLAMKGHYAKEEIAALSGNVKEQAVYELQIPGLSAKRCLIELVPG